MDIQIVHIFGENEVPRYAVGKISDDSYAVLSPINEGDNSLEFKLNDTIELLTISEGPVSALNKTTNKEISVGVCEKQISADRIRAKYYQMFK